MRRFAPQLFAQLFCISLTVFSLSNCYGQVGHRPASQEQIQNRDWARGNPQQGFHHQSARQKLLALRSLKDDFRKLQIVNNQLMVRVFEPSANPTEKMTNKELRSCLGEIKKIAERLRSSLNIPKVERVEQANQVELARGLLLLDQAVMSFAHNPMFQQPRVYDAELASRAGRDLSEVLTLAKALQKLTNKD